MKGPELENVFFSSHSCSLYIVVGFLFFLLPSLSVFAKYNYVGAQQVLLHMLFAI
jgi:hypothetical protein